MSSKIKKEKCSVKNVYMSAKLNKRPLFNEGSWAFQAKTRRKCDRVFRRTLADSP